MHNNVNVSVGGPVNVDVPKTYNTKFLKPGIPFSQQVTDADTKYVIKYDLDLGGEDVEMPDGCVLDFDGGSVNNGNIIGQSTAIDAEPVQIFGLNVELSGTFAIDKFYTEWHGAKADGVTVCNEAFQKSCDNAIRINAPIQLLGGTYIIDEYYGTIFINMEKDGQNFVMNGAGKYLTEIKTPADTIDRIYNHRADMWDNNDPEAMSWAAEQQAAHDARPDKYEAPSKEFWCDLGIYGCITFYAIPVYGGKYATGYNAGTLKVSNLTFNKNCHPEQITARPRINGGWEKNRCFDVVPEYGGQTGTYKEIIFENIDIKDRVSCGLSTHAVECESCIYRNITNSDFNNPWQIREAVICSANANKLLLEDCVSDYYQIEITATQVPGRHVNAIIRNCNLGGLEWNDKQLEEPEKSSLLIEKTSIGGYFNISGNYPIKVQDCNIIVNNINTTIFDPVEFRNCNFYFPYVEGLVGSIWHRGNKASCTYIDCSFVTDELPEGGNGTLFKGQAVALELHPLVTFKRCSFDVKLNSENALFDGYGKNNYFIEDCYIKLNADSPVAYVGEYASGCGNVEFVNNTVINDNKVFLINVPVGLSYAHSRIVGDYKNALAVLRTGGSGTATINGDGFVIDNNDAPLPCNGGFPVNGCFIKNGIIYKVIKGGFAINATIPVNSENYIAEFVNKNMTTAERTALNSLPALPMEAYDVTLGKPVYWTGSTWVDALGNAVDTDYQTGIDSTHKLSADLVEDGSTNKVVTATEKEAWNGKQDAVTGVNGNFAGFGADGKLKDSGSKPSDFTPAES